MIITKPPKPSIAIFTRRSKKEAGKGGSEVVFSKPPLTFQERVKQMEGAGITNFKALKYETRSEVEKK